MIMNPVAVVDALETSWTRDQKSLWDGALIYL
jgi:hypothetical protein